MNIIVWTVLYRSDEDSYICGVFKLKKEALDYIDKQCNSEYLYEIEYWNLKAD